jgi:hypothetical protein
MGYDLIVCDSTVFWSGNAEPLADEAEIRCGHTRSDAGSLHGNNAVAELKPGLITRCLGGFSQQGVYETGGPLPPSPRGDPSRVHFRGHFRQCPGLTKAECQGLKLSPKRLHLFPVPPVPRCARLPLVLPAQSPPG